MADIYQFSQSSLEARQQCIEAANQQGTKWLELFRPGTYEQTTVKQENISFSDQDTIIISQQSAIDLNVDDQSEYEKTEHNQIERIAAVIEAEPSNKIKYISERCTNDLMLSALGERLSAENLQIICEELLESFNFQDDLIKHFLTAYIMKETITSALNLLDRAYRAYRTTVLSLMESLFINPDISSMLLEEFFNCIDKSIYSQTVTQFLQTLSFKELPTDVFILRINIINQMFKSCDRTPEIQNFLLNELFKHRQRCQADKNYGRCLLTFFQGLQANDQVNRQDLERLITSHQTPFKKLCQSILSNLQQVNNNHDD